MQTKPQQEHAWLHRLVGEWALEMDANMAAPQEDHASETPPTKVTGTEVVRSLGGLWVLCEGHWQMGGMDSDSDSVMSLSYDPVRQKYVGSFVTSMMAYLWIYEGSLDESGNILTLDSLGPNFAGGDLARYQDIIEILGEDERTLSSQILKEDGSWHRFMTVHYQRKR